MAATGPGQDSVSPGEDHRFSLVWSEALRAIERQAAAVDELRARAVSIIGVSAVVAAFLGQNALQRGGAAADVGVWAFSVTGLSAVYVLFPRKWTFIVHPRDIIRNHIDREDGTGLDQLHWALAEELATAYDKNQKRRRPMSAAVWLACAALVTEVLSWMVAL